MEDQDNCLAEWRRHQRLLRRLKRKLKPKIFQAIESEMDYHICHDFEIVRRSQVKGKKRSAHDYFGESAAIRHVYDDTSFNSYTESYAGNVFLRLSNDRYLRIFVSG